MSASAGAQQMDVNSTGFPDITTTLAPITEKHDERDLSNAGSNSTTKGNVTSNTLSSVETIDTVEARDLPKPTSTLSSSSFTEIPVTFSPSTATNTTQSTTPATTTILTSPLTSLLKSPPTTTTTTKASTTTVTSTTTPTTVTLSATTPTTKDTSALSTRDSNSFLTRPEWLYNTSAFNQTQPPPKSTVNSTSYTTSVHNLTTGNVTTANVINVTSTLANSTTVPLLSGGSNSTTTINNTLPELREIINVTTQAANATSNSSASVESNITSTSPLPIQSTQQTNGTTTSAFISQNTTINATTLLPSAVEMSNGSTPFQNITTVDSNFTTAINATATLGSTLAMTTVPTEIAASTVINGTDEEPTTEIPSIVVEEEEEDHVDISVPEEPTHKCPETPEKMIFPEQICDGKVDCPRATDETNCSCKSRLGASRICDGVFDCPSLDDEMGCRGRHLHLEI